MPESTFYLLSHGNDVGKVYKEGMVEFDYNHFAIPSEITDLGNDYHELLTSQKRQSDIMCLLMEVVPPIRKHS